MGSQYKCTNSECWRCFTSSVFYYMHIRIRMVWIWNLQYTRSTGWAEFLKRSFGRKTCLETIEASQNFDWKDFIRNDKIRKKHQIYRKAFLCLKKWTEKCLSHFTHEVITLNKLSNVFLQIFHLDLKKFVVFHTEAVENFFNVLNQYLQSR